MHIHLGVLGGRGRLLARRRWDFVPEHRAVGRGRPSTDIVPLSLCPSAPTVQSRSPKSRQEVFGGCVSSPAAICATWTCQAQRRSPQKPTEGFAPLLKI